MTQDTSNSHISPPIRQRWAFLVGIDYYIDPRFKRLNFCVNDVVALENLLTKLGYAVVAMHDQHPEEHRHPTKDNVAAELEQICQQVGENDLLLVHFACHGKLQAGQPILIMRDSRDTLLSQPEKRLSVVQVEQMMRDSGASQLFLSLDACHTGVEMGRGADDPEFIQNVYELAEGFVVMAGSTAQQKAQEWEAVNHGVYTYYLLKALSGEAARDGHSFVSVDDIEKYVVHNLKIWGIKNGGLIQEPTIKKEGMGDMMLADWRDRTPPVFSISAPDTQAHQLPSSSRAVALPTITPGSRSIVLSPAQWERQELEKEYANLEKKNTLLSEQIEGELNEDNKDTLRTRRESIKRKMNEVWHNLQNE